MLADGMLAVLVCLHTYTRVYHHGPFAGQAVLVAGQFSLLLRQRAPGSVLAITTGSVVVFAVMGGEVSPLPFATLIALYAVASRYQLWFSLSAASLVLLGISAAMTITLGRVDDDVLDRLPLILAAWLLGYGSRLGRERTALMERQTAQLEREQAARTRLAVVEEQARIARELHDIVAYHITVIVALATSAAATARHAAAAKLAGSSAGRTLDASAHTPSDALANTTPADTLIDASSEVLATIATSGRQALGELRKLLGALRPDAGPGSDPESPWPGLHEVPVLIDQVERSGLRVELIVRGTPRPLPLSVELNAYRIIQEALTNALKHAGPATAQVELDYQPMLLALRISDDGAGAAAPAHLAPASALSFGHGLVGMVHRAAVLGGKLNVGPGPGRSFQISAQLPVPEA